MTLYILLDPAHPQNCVHPQDPAYYHRPWGAGSLLSQSPSVAMLTSQDPFYTPEATHPPGSCSIPRLCSPRKTLLTLRCCHLSLSLSTRQTLPTYRCHIKPPRCYPPVVVPPKPLRRCPPALVPSNPPDAVHLPSSFPNPQTLNTWRRPPNPPDATHLPLSLPTPQTRMVWMGWLLRSVRFSGSTSFREPSSRSMNRSLPCRSGEQTG